MRTLQPIRGIHTPHDIWTCECDACWTEREDRVDRWIDGQSEREQAYREAADVAEMKKLRTEPPKK